MSNDNPSMTKLENDIVTTRDRLAQTIDELTVRAAPKNVVARQKEQAKASFTAATRTESGELRIQGMNTRDGQRGLLGYALDCLLADVVEGPVH